MQGTAGASRGAAALFNNFIMRKKKGKKRALGICILVNPFRYFDIIFFFQYFQILFFFPIFLQKKKYGVNKIMKQWKKDIEDATDFLVSCWDENNPEDNMSFDERVRSRLDTLSPSVREVVVNAMNW